jgi:superfamily I DNA/RNA helicase
MSNPPRHGSAEPHPSEKYNTAKEERQNHVDAVLSSPSRKKVVVAGPGTGKTHLFKQILKGKTKTLTLTFVNSLVDDLSLDLCGLSEVKTLHSFARATLTSPTKKIHVFPKLSKLIQKDALVLLNTEIDFDHIFHNRHDADELIDFYKQRKDFYGHYGYADVIYALVKYFEKTPRRIPIYEQIVVDEFQDFNKLEVSLIDLLAQKSPILLAGDDDQALYDFKSASTEHIRQKHTSKDSEFASFSLPYCSRCTRVIVDATNDIITAAKEAGHLKGRINKSFLYFDDELKDKESTENAKIVYASAFEKQMPLFIEQRLEELAKQLKQKFDVLIISPFRVQSRSLVRALREKGFQNVEFPDKQDPDEPTLLEGLKLLLADRKSNLGWRIASRHCLNQSDFDSALHKTHPPGTQTMVDILSAKCKKEINQLLKSLRAIRDDKTIEDGSLSEILEKLDLSPNEIVKTALRDEIVTDMPKSVAHSVRKLAIKATTIQSSKGLAARCVFITHFDDQFLVKSKEKKLSDQDICSFLVALTRARTKVFLISSDSGKEPTFLRWIRKERIERHPAFTRVDT